MSKPADFIQHGLARLEESDWRACWASPPVDLSDLETGEAYSLWVHFRPIAAIERQAWGLPADGFGHFGVMTSADLGAGEQYLLERFLVRLPAGVRAPLSAGQCAWAATFLGEDDYIKLTPAAVDRLRIAKPLAAEVSA